MAKLLNGCKRLAPLRLRRDVFDHLAVSILKVLTAWCHSAVNGNVLRIGKRSQIAIRLIR